MHRIYLDQNKWIDLMRGRTGDPLGERFRDAAVVIEAAVERDEASFPLSFAHVFETWKARKAERRKPLAQTMAAISKNHAIAPPWELLPPELDRAFQSRFGRPYQPLPLRAFGWGMRHSSGGRAPELRKQTIERLLEVSPRLTEQEVTEQIDAILLAGPAADLPAGEIRQPPLEPAESFAQDENEQVERFKKFGASKEERRRAVAARAFLDIKDEIFKAQERSRVGSDDILALGPDGLTQFLLDLPSRAGVLELSWLQHDNPSIKWQPNDLNDVVFLSLAFAYCDVVVTERKWRHMYEQSGLPDRFGTMVLADLAELPEALIAASAG